VNLTLNIESPRFNIGDKVRARKGFLRGALGPFTVIEVKDRRSDKDRHGLSYIQRPNELGNFNFIIENSYKIKHDVSYGAIQKILECPEYIKEL